MQRIKTLYGAKIALLVVRSSAVALHLLRTPLVLPVPLPDVLLYGSELPLESFKHLSWCNWSMNQQTALYELINALECRPTIFVTVRKWFHAMQIPRTGETARIFSTLCRTRASIVLHAPVTTLKSWHDKRTPLRENSKTLCGVPLQLVITIYHMQVRQFHQVMKHYNTASAVLSDSLPVG